MNKFLKKKDKKNARKQSIYTSDIQQNSSASGPTCTTVPLDIQTDGATKCVLKCLLHYKYGDSACAIKNNNTSISLSYDGTSDVVFNNAKFTPTEIRIFKPSLHTYSGKPAEAELIIVHNSSQGGLLICVPLTTSLTLTRGSYLLSDIISAAPTNGTSSANIPDYNANYLIPTSRYFTYDGPLPYGPCTTQTYHYVVFHPQFGTIGLTSDTMKLLDGILNPHYIASAKGNVFVNMKGTTSNGFAGDGQIYIDCQPTGQSEEEVVFKDAATPTVPNDIIMTVLMIIIGIILIYATFMIMKMVLGKVSKVSAPTATNK